ncbi:formate dehydrogenase accessory sulfurtransferase FdhD [Paenibacillus spongiae]|uniref:Sulfur carrier protein FdhD n=1 Tax=Paenibacillus spongiae TaxID=2909671 RepID=A0ABY5SA34_9BACL|nr:formate dehydrogenase accessory sulfurtransferase FdhD [Paenibacillus spongiae]UVI30796.1 formate dehydrogenase accessory sulfurtransferase FdhD [Paenibacillus spongiae]
MSLESTTNWRTWKIDGDAAAETDDDIAAEYPLTFQLDGEEFATIVCSPSALEEMAVGFLASEGVIRTIDDIASLRIDEDRGYIYAELRHKQSTAKTNVSKRFIGSCCGKSRQFYFMNDVQTARTSTSRIQVTAGEAIRLMRMLQQSSAEFQATGGLHNAAICTADSLLAVRADIGRHNALDKLLGYCLHNRVRTADLIIAFSGRLSSEVILKAAKIGVGMILSKSAPTDLALQLAHDLGITSAGFIRGEKMNVYTHPQRIMGSSASSS